MAMRCSDKRNRQLRDVSLLRPRVLALFLALAYLGVCLAYIYVSGLIAGRAATSVADLERLEWLKGAGFVVVTSSLLFLYSLVLFRSIAQRERDLRRHRDAVIELERRATTGLFAASVAHDISNVLVICQGALADLEADKLGLNPEALALVAELGEAVDELGGLAERLHTVGTANSEENELHETDLVQVVKKTVALAKSHQDVRFCGIHLDLPDRLVTRANASMIHQLLLNLILNAAQATRCEGSVLIRVSAEQDVALIDVHDNGPGVPEEKRDRVFSPFYSTRKEGCGLGLLAVRAYVNAHNGAVEVLDSYLGGACFRVRLPLVAAAGE